AFRAPSFPNVFPGILRSGDDGVMSPTVTGGSPRPRRSSAAQPRGPHGRFVAQTAALVSADVDLVDDDELRSPEGPTTPLDDPLPEDRYLNRELSWLDFNARVLTLAEDPEIPLLERAKYLAIFAGNLDEFYMVRVAGLKRRM